MIVLHVISRSNYILHLYLAASNRYHFMWCDEMFISLTVIGSSFIPLQSLIINENYYHFIARLAAIASLKALQSLPLSFIIYFKFIFNFSRARDPFASVVRLFSLMLLIHDEEPVNVIRVCMETRWRVDCVCAVAVVVVLQIAISKQLFLPLNDCKRIKWRTTRWIFFKMKIPLCWLTFRFPGSWAFYS